MKRRLFTPGPTTVPDRVLLKMAEPIIHHRSPEFGRMFRAVNEELKYLFQTRKRHIKFSTMCLELRKYKKNLLVF